MGEAPQQGLCDRRADLAAVQVHAAAFALLPGT